MKTDAVLRGCDPPVLRSAPLCGLTLTAWCCCSKSRSPLRPLTAETRPSPSTRSSRRREARRSSKSGESSSARRQRRR
eukprot:2725142-Prymnesium_polylepis.1